MGVETNTTLADSAVPVAVGSAPKVELSYVGFWLRLAAYAIGFAILLPYGLLARQVIYTSRSAYLADLIIGTLRMGLKDNARFQAVVAKNVSVGSPFVTAIEHLVKAGFSCDDRSAAPAVSCTRDRMSIVLRSASVSRLTR